MDEIPTSSGIEEIPQGAPGRHNDHKEIGRKVRYRIISWQPHSLERKKYTSPPKAGIHICVLFSLED